MSRINSVGLSYLTSRAVKSISIVADENSLLKNPLEEINAVQFESPLSAEEQKLFNKYNAQIDDISSQIDNLDSAYPASNFVAEPRPQTAESAESDILDADYGDNMTESFSHNTGQRTNPAWSAAQTKIKTLKDSRNRIIAARKPLLDKHNVAYKKYLQSRHAATDDKNVLIDEFAALVDKFEVFRTEGLIGLDKVVNSKFERAARNFMADEVEMIFASEYIVDDQFVGMLLCFEVYKNATHYEIYKKNLFQSNGSFERIVYLDAANLREETANYIPYVRDQLGLTQLQEDKIFIILDDVVKQDRIYEYKVGAARVPQQASEVDYDLILESKKLLSTSTLGVISSVTLSEFAGSLFGSDDLAWALCAVNENIPYFGRESAESSLRDIIVEPTPSGKSSVLVYTPKDINDVLYIIKQSISLLGLKPTILHLIKFLGGLPTETFQIIESSLDENTNLFSYTAFRESLKNTVPVFNLILDIAETQDESALRELTKMSVAVPNNEGSENVTTVLGLTRVLRFISDVSIALVYSQDKSSFQRLKEIRALIELNREREDPIEEAVRENSEEIADQTSEVSPQVEDLYAAEESETNSNASIRRQQQRGLFRRNNVSVNKIIIL